MKTWRNYTFQVNGFAVKCRYSDTFIKEVCTPLIQRLSKLQEERQERIMVFFAAPPAVGKSTMVSFLAHLSKEMKLEQKVQAIGLDGFHFHADYIESHTVVVDGVMKRMKDIKGAPETFDVDKLCDTLERMRIEDVLWPVYDRNLHDVVEDAIEVTGDIILLEGNWLLLNQGKWAKVKGYCDDSIMIYAKESMLRERLIQRKMQGGLTREAAEEFCEASDLANVRRVLEHSFHGNLELHMQEDGDYMDC